MREWENALLLHDRKVYTEALNPVLCITEFADGAKRFTPPDEILSAGLLVLRIEAN